MIVDRAGHNVFVEPDPDAPDGESWVLITVTPTPNSEASKARFTVCDLPLLVAPGSTVSVSCGSVSVRVIEGAAQVELDNGTVVNVPLGVTAKVAQDESGVYTVTHLGGDSSIDVRDPDGNLLGTIGPEGSADTTPPHVAVTGVTDGARYTFGSVPEPGCTTSDDGSGVQVEARPVVVGGEADGTGLHTATCAGATDWAGNTAEPVGVTFTVDPSPVQQCAGKRATIVGPAGGGTVNGTNGNDVIWVPAGTHEINAYGGNDTICAGSGDKVIDAGSGNDIVYAGDGNNTINAGAGNDTVVSGSGNDEIDGGDGNDTINAGDGDNIITGGTGNDTITSGAGEDRIWGGDGNDTVRAGGGDDEIHGEAGNDQLHGEDGDDWITGGTGNDRLDGGPGTNELNGVAGNDTCILGGPNSNAVNCKV